MGGGSSNDEKTNQINKKVMEELINAKDENLRKSLANQKKNSPKNSPRNNNSSIYSPGGKQQLNNMTLNSPRQKYNQSRINKGNINSNEFTLQNQNNINRIFENNQQLTGEKQVFQNIFLPISSKYKVCIQMFKIQPIMHKNNFEGARQIQFLNESEDSYEANFKWIFDMKSKLWKFNLQQPKSPGFKFVSKLDGQIQQGNIQMWQILNPSFSYGPKNELKFYLQQSIYRQYKDYNEQRDYFSRSIDDLKKNKKSLYSKWNEELVQPFAQFYHKKIKTYKVRQGQDDEDNNYREVKRYFYRLSNQWHLSVCSSQKEGIFESWMIWKILQENKQNKYLQELIQKQKRLINLKKQIYVRKMYKLKIKGFQ